MFAATRLKTEANSSELPNPKNVFLSEKSKFSFFRIWFKNREILFFYDFQIINLEKIQKKNTKSLLSPEIHLMKIQTKNKSQTIEFTS